MLYISQEKKEKEVKKADYLNAVCLFDFHTIYKQNFIYVCVSQALG